MLKEKRQPKTYKPPSITKVLGAKNPGMSSKVATKENKIMDL